MATAAGGRAYVAGKYGIELDGIKAGWVWSVEGGHGTSEVVQEKVGSDHIIKKHLAGVKYEDVSVQCGTGMSRAFYEWMKDSFAHRYTRKNGSIIAADYNYREFSRMTFFQALITEIGFPALDAASKDAAKMTIKFKPETTRTTLREGGSTIAGQFPNQQVIQKKWLPANFRLRIDGTPRGCSRVNKVEAIVVKQKVTENPVGEMREYEQEPLHLEIPNLVITMPESHADEFYQWHEDFVIRGNNGDDKERGGTLEFLTPNLKETLFQLDFMHLGVFKLTPEKVESGSEQLRRVKVEMYCEEMNFDYRAAWA